MEELSKRELLALRELHMNGELSDQDLVRKFVERDIIADLNVSGLLLTHKGRSLLVRGSPALWDVAA